MDHQILEKQLAKAISIKSEPKLSHLKLEQKLTKIN